jgi:FkbM family methyltransferase
MSVTTSTPTPTTTPGASPLRRSGAALRRKSPVLGGYVHCFGRARGIAYFIAVEVLNRWHGHPVRQRVDARTTVTLRLGTSDYRVFNDVFRSGDYDFPFDTPPESIVDAGAYTGLSTVWSARRFPKAHIVAIEPDPENLALLRDNVAGLTAVSVVPAALWPTPGTLELVDPGSGPWAYQTRPAGEAHNTDDVPTRAVVPTISVAQLLEAEPSHHIDLLKLDIEGAEVEVLEQAASWIDEVGAICLELHDRFRSGCSRAFYGAVRGFPVEARRGENVLVVRRADQLVGAGTRTPSSVNTSA